MSEQKVILITGCSSGLGLALARALYQDPEYKVVITARQKSLYKIKNEFQESPRFLIRELDVMEGEQMDSLVNEICCLWKRVDILINNAGVCYRSVVEHMDTEAEMIQIKSNYLGPMNLIRRVLPIMREQGSGYIMNVSSVSGMVSMPTMASYSASKHALEGATEALWYEARPYGIRVSLIEPGFIDSDSFKKVVLSKKASLSSKLHGPHSEYYDSMTPFIERLMHLSFSTPEKIAGKMIRLLKKKNPSLRVSVTLDAAIFRFSRWLLPAGLFHRIMFFFLPNSKNWGESRPRLEPLKKVSNG